MSEASLPLAKKLQYALETALVYLVYGFFRVMPMDMASAVGGKLTRTLGPLFGLSRVAARNIDLAFPEKTPEEKRQILLGMWENLGRVVGEYPHLRRIGQRVEVVGREYVAPLQGKGAVLYGAHLANWEVCPVMARDVGLPLHVVYRKPNNPWVHSLLQYARGGAAEGQIRKGTNGARDVFAVLRADKPVGMLVDQKMSEGIPVPFFGRDAMTAHAMAHFALKRGYPLHALRIERMGGVKFRLTLYPALDTTPTGDLDADALRIMTEVNRQLESWIRERPEQWLWIHRRWPDSK